jgi:hypothetical protein
MALTGIAAVARYGFGMARDGEISFDYRVLTDQGRIDFDTASQMADDIDPGGKLHVLGEAWTLAASLVADPESWAAIEWLAGIIEGVELDGAAVAHIVRPGEGVRATEGRECPA